MLPVLMVLALGTVYLCDMVVARIKNHEAARYAAFAMAKVSLSDYRGGNHTVRRNQVRDVIEDQTREIYQDFDSGREHVAGRAGGLALSGELAIVSVETSSIPVVPGDTIREVLNASGVDNAALRFVLDLVLGAVNELVLNQVGKLGFNTSAMVEATVSSSWSNRLMPGILAGSPTTARLDRFTLRDSVVVLGDSWALDDGRDVRSPGYIGATYGSSSEESGFRKQVAKISNISAIAPTALQGVLNSMTSALDVLFDGEALTPLSTRVSSLNYSNDSNAHPHRGRAKPFDDSFSSPRGKEDEQRVFETNHFEETRSPRPNVEALQVRGAHFMGCVDAQKRRCTYHTR